MEKKKMKHGGQSEKSVLSVWTVWAAIKLSRVSGYGVFEGTSTR